MVETNHKLVIEQERDKQATLEQEILLLKPGQRIRATGKVYDFENANRFWEKHGIVEAKALLLDKDGKKYDDNQGKGIFQNGYLMKDVSREYVTFPNEEVIDIAYKLVGDSSTGLRIWKEPEFSNHGLDMHIPILSDSHARKIEASDEQNDIVRLGVVIRNSLGGGLALGTDLFTFRDVCSNGAIFGHKDIGHISMRHYGRDSGKITRLMRDLITSSVSRIEEIYNYYERMCSFKLSERQFIIRDLGEYIPDKYYPDYIEIEREKVATEINAEGKATETKEIKKYNIGKSALNLSVWHVFNDFTKNLWHSQLNMERKRYTTMNLHRVVIDAISK